MPKKAVKTSLGMEENIEALIAYILGWITGIVFFIIEKNSKYVKIHAAQSFIWFFGLMIVDLILGILFRGMPMVGYIFSMIVNIVFWVVGLGTWIWLMVSVYQGKDPKIPVVRKLAESMA